MVSLLQLSQKKIGLIGKKKKKKTVKGNKKCQRKWLKSQVLNSKSSTTSKDYSYSYNLFLYCFLAFGMSSLDSVVTEKKKIQMGINFALAHVVVKKKK